MKNNIGDFGRHLEEHETVVVHGVTIDGAHVRAVGTLTLFDDCSDRIHVHQGEQGEPVRKRPAYFVELNGGTCFVFRDYELFVPGTEPAPGDLDDDDDVPAFELADDEPSTPAMVQHFRSRGEL